MSRGLPYDSDEGRAFAAAITALMTGRAYRKSAEIAGRMGLFAGYQPNAGAMIGVIAKQRAAVGNIENAHAVPDDLLCRPAGLGRRASTSARSLGLPQRATVLGAHRDQLHDGLRHDRVEPDFSLVKMKKPVGGGDLTIVNKTVPMALDRMGYAPEECDQVVAFIDDRNTVVGVPFLKTEHYPVFDCAIGERAIHYMGQRADDGRRPALHLGCHLEDRQPRGDDRRRDLPASSTRGSSGSRRSRSTATTARSPSRSRRR